MIKLMQLLLLNWACFQCQFCANALFFQQLILRNLVHTDRGERNIPFFFLIYFIEVELIYNIVLVSAVQHSDSVIHTYAFFF